MDRLKTLYASLRALLALGVAHGAALPVRAQAPDPEQRAWEQALAEGTPEAFQDYLDRFPLGRYATEAFRQLVARSLGSEIEPSAGPPESPAEPRDLY